MIYQFPSSTKDLVDQLEAAMNKMKQKDRNMFVQDLIKFCIDWQFQFLAIRESEKDNGI